MNSKQKCSIKKKNTKLSFCDVKDAQQQRVKYLFFQKTFLRKAWCLFFGKIDIKVDFGENV